MYLTEAQRTAAKLKLNINRGVAQLVARDVWDVDAAGSNPVTPTSGKLPPPIIGDARHKSLPYHTMAKFGY